MLSLKTEDKEAVLQRPAIPGRGKSKSKESKMPSAGKGSRGDGYFKVRLQL